MDKLKHWLKDNHLTQKDFADRLGVTPTYLGFLLNGQRKPGPALAQRLEQHTGIHRGHFRPDLWEVSQGTLAQKH